MADILEGASVFNLRQLDDYDDGFYYDDWIE